MFFIKLIVFIRGKSGGVQDVQAGQNFLCWSPNLAGNLPRSQQRPRENIGHGVPARSASDKVLMVACVA